MRTWLLEETGVAAVVDVEVGMVSGATGAAVAFAFGDGDGNGEGCISLGDGTGVVMAAGAVLAVAL